jgi:hypothetical protein
LKLGFIFMQTSLLLGGKSGTPEKADEGKGNKQKPNGG